MSNRYHHPEGVHRGINFLDWKDWTLERYVRCLNSPALLDECIRVAHEEAAARSNDSLDGEKWTLRYHGLQTLKGEPK